MYSQNYQDENGNIININRLQYYISSIDLTNNTGWWTLDITNEAGSAASPFSNSEDILVSFVSVGDKGDTGAQGIQGTQGTTGAQGIQGTQGIEG